MKKKKTIKKQTHPTKTNIKKKKRKTNLRQLSIHKRDIRINGLKILQYFLGTNKCILSL